MPNKVAPVEQQLVLDFERIPQQVALLTPDEIFREFNQDLLVRIFEDDRLERKPPMFGRDQLAEYFSMWANTAPEGGLVVLGVADNGEVIGCSCLEPKQFNDRLKAGRDLCPDAVYDTKRVEMVRQDGVMDFVVLFRIRYREDKVVETVHGDAFRRVGDSKCKMTEEEKRSLAIDKGQVSLEQEPCLLQYPEDFSMDAVRAFVQAVKQIKGLRTEYTPEQILANRRLGKLRDGLLIPNIACALLFAKEPRDAVPGCFIRFQRYEGTERLTGQRRNVVKDIAIEGRITDLIADADKTIQAQIRTFSRLGRDGKFVTAPEYPRAAWYEAIVNACVHRSYHLKNMNTFIRMFDDRLEIESPGGFPPFVTPQNIYEVHQRRNFFLMDALFFMDYVKCENEGTRRMRDEMKAMDLPAPEFQQKAIDNVVVRVTLRNNVQQRKAWIDRSAADVVGESVFNTLDETQKLCINCAADHPDGINVSDAMRAAKVGWQKAKKILDNLCEMEVLEYISRFERDPNAHYRLRPKAKQP